MTTAQTVHRRLTVQLPRDGVLYVEVTTARETLRRDECNRIAKELREIADVFEKMETPEEPS